MSQPCKHANVLVISQDDSGKFLECLDCKEIFESSEFEEPDLKPEHKEDLSDA